METARTYKSEFTCPALSWSIKIYSWGETFPITSQFSHVCLWFLYACTHVTLTNSWQRGRKKEKKKRFWMPLNVSWKKSPNSVNDCLCKNGPGGKMWKKWLWEQLMGKECIIVNKWFFFFFFLIIWCFLIVFFKYVFVSVNVHPWVKKHTTSWAQWSSEWLWKSSRTIKLCSHQIRQDYIQSLPEDTIWRLASVSSLVAWRCRVFRAKQSRHDAARQVSRLNVAVELITIDKRRFHAVTANRKRDVDVLAQDVPGMCTV